MGRLAPLPPRVLSSSSDAARGTNGTLRADYNGQTITLADPTIDRALSAVLAERFALPHHAIDAPTGL